MKPRDGCGGRLIEVWDNWAAEHARPAEPYYFQERAGGTPAAITAVGDGAGGASGGAVYLQLPADPPWSFRYTGTVGPVPCGPRLRAAVRLTVACLAETFRPVGPFGVDAILASRGPRAGLWVVEVNPRFSVSTGLDWLANPTPRLDPDGTWRPAPDPPDEPGGRIVGARIVYADDPGLRPRPAGLPAARGNQEPPAPPGRGHIPRRRGVLPRLAGLHRAGRRPRPDVRGDPPADPLGGGEAPARVGARSDPGRNARECYAARMSNPNDVRVVACEVTFEPVPFRAPLKFGGRVVDRTELINAAVTVERRDGKTATGLGSMPVGNVWAWPSDVTDPETAERAMKRFAEETAWNLESEGTFGDSLQIADEGLTDHEHSAGGSDGVGRARRPDADARATRRRLPGGRRPA